MKKIILSVVALLIFGFAHSQREGGFRVGLDMGIIPANGGLGISFDIEPKYNIKENMSVGLRIGGAAIARDVEESGITTSVTATAIGSYIGTFDYYFPSGKSFVPFVGGGIGYATALSVRADEDANIDNLDPDSGFGGVIRGGFEWGKFRMNLEYNFVPKTPLYLNGPLTNEDISNSYFAVNLGFYIGGGKWKKN
jgi:outer membrane protein X